MNDSARLGALLLALLAFVAPVAAQEKKPVSGALVTFEARDGKVVVRDTRSARLPCTSRPARPPRRSSRPAPSGPPSPPTSRST